MHWFQPGVQGTTRYGRSLREGAAEVAVGRLRVDATRRRKAVRERRADAADGTCIFSLFEISVNIRLCWSGVCDCNEYLVSRLCASWVRMGPVNYLLMGSACYLYSDDMEDKGRVITRVGA